MSWSRRIRVLSVALSLLAGIAGAAPNDYAGKPVKAIEFSPETQPYPIDYLLGILPLKVNQPLRLADVRAAIERLYATGRYADIDVDARPAEDGAVLRFITRNNYFIGHISVERVPQPPNEGVLVNSTRLQLGSLYTEENLGQAVRNLSDALKNNGLYESRIEPSFEYDPITQQVNIHFSIVPGRRAHYRIPVIVGNPERPVPEIIGTTHWKGWFGWKPVTEARTQDGVQRVRRSYQKEDRLEARVSLEKLDYNEDTRRVTPAIGVEAGPKIQIRVVGAKVSRGRLRQLIPVYEEQTVDRDLLVEGRRNLTEYLESQGYFDAKVDFTTTQVNASSETILYQVQPGVRHKVALVEITGNKFFDRNTIRERMYVRPASILQFRHGRYSDEFLERDLDTIRALYQANGFRDVQVTSHVEHGYGGKQNRMAVYVRIDEGPLWLVEKLDVQGVSPENREMIEGLLQSTAGQPFSDLNVSVDRDNVLDYLFNQGYSNAAFSWSSTPAAEPHRVSLKYVVQEGRRRFVRQVLLSGLQATDPGLVKERLELQPGDPLSRARALDTQRRLYDLGIFARVDMALQDPGGNEERKYVLVDMEEARKYTITGGLGAEIAKIGGCRTCLDVPAGQAGFSPRASLGITRRNFLGNGHIISLQGRASTLEQRVVLSYQAPQFQGSSNVSLLFSGLYDDSHDVNTFTSHRREVSVQVGQKLSKASTMLYRISYRRVTVDADTLKVQPELIPFYSQPARIGVVAVNYIQDRRDDPVDSHRGIYNTVDVGWSPEAFGSQTTFTRFLGHNATYYPIGLGSRFVLARSLTFGWLQTLAKNSDIPLPERFFAGGAQSHRGFGENQAGPRDLETGFPIGGKAILVHQVEFRYPLIGENIRGVFFEDAGNVYSGLNHLSLRVFQKGNQDFDYMVHAVGWGLRYKTPVGPLRIDVGYTLNPPRFYGCKGTLQQLYFGCPERTVQRTGNFQFHFSLGQAF